MERAVFARGRTAEIGRYAGKYFAATMFDGAMIAASKQADTTSACARYIYFFLILRSLSFLMISARQPDITYAFHSIDGSKHCRVASAGHWPP